MAQHGHRGQHTQLVTCGAAWVAGSPALAHQRPTVHAGVQQWYTGRIWETSGLQERLRRQRDRTVTGGAGYIGSHTVRALLDTAREVVVLDTLETGHVPALLGAPFVRRRHR